MPISLPNPLQQKLIDRAQSNALRQLGKNNQNCIDFSSNDYLGFSRNKDIFDATHQYLLDHQIIQNGATGSRLLSGNFALYNQAEKYMADFHQSEAALIYNSGYDANVGFFSAVLQKGDVILYDEYIHASIRDGVRLSLAKAYKFQHNDLVDLEHKILQHQKNMVGTIYVATESVFSMDGDRPDLKTLVQLCQKHSAYLIVDEAHSLGVFGNNGEGALQQLNLHEAVFARIVTFGKGLGCHGAAILGSQELITYLINFSRSFIYTTGLSLHSVATVYVAYQFLKTEAYKEAQNSLHENITHFNNEVNRLHLHTQFIKSQSAIHCCIISGNQKVKKIATQLQETGFDVKPIMSPTVAEGQERLRFCLHSYNSKAEITQVLDLLNHLVISE